MFNCSKINRNKQPMISYRTTKYETAGSVGYMKSGNLLNFSYDIWRWRPWCVVLLFVIELLTGAIRNRCCLSSAL